MDQHLNAFIEAHPDGWDHVAWLGLLADLEENGIDVSDPAAIGYQLENQRLAWELRRREVPGLGQKRIDAVVEQFGTLWSLQHADVEDFADIKKSVPGKLAEKVVAAVR
jgi:hypothetical protein